MKSVQIKKSNSIPVEEINNYNLVAGVINSTYVFYVSHVAFGESLRMSLNIVNKCDDLFSRNGYDLRGTVEDLLKFYANDINEIFVFETPAEMWQYVADKCKEYV